MKENMRRLGQALESTSVPNGRIGCVMLLMKSLVHTFIGWVRQNTPGMAHGLKSHTKIILKIPICAYTVAVYRAQSEFVHNNALLYGFNTPRAAFCTRVGNYLI